MLLIDVRFLVIEPFDMCTWHFLMSDLHGFCGTGAHWAEYPDLKSQTIRWMLLRFGCHWSIVKMTMIAIYIDEHTSEPKVEIVSIKLMRWQFYSEQEFRFFSVYVFLSLHYFFWSITIIEIKQLFSGYYWEHLYLKEWWVEAKKNQHFIHLFKDNDLANIPGGFEKSLFQ